MSNVAKRVCGRAVVAGVMAVVAVGCGGGTKHPVVPAQGKITFTDGKTLPKGTRVVLNPSEGGSGTASGATEDDGTFKLTHVTGREGAEVGKYTVVLLAPEGDSSGDFFKLVPKDYYDGGQLTAEIKAGMQPLAFTVPRAKK